jgi:hypothetical protein
VLKCLYSGCGYKFEQSEIKAFTTQLVFNKYLRFKRNNQINSYKGKMVFFCPYPDCEEVFAFDPHTRPFVECKNKHKSCIKCKTQGWHKGNCNRVKFVYKF